MALGDGVTWDESTPVDGTNAVQIDDYIRHYGVGVRKRMANEHEWPSSQSATSEAGAHKYMTLQAQSVKPTLAGTQVGAVYQDTSGQLCYENSAGVVVIITTGTSVVQGTPIGSAGGMLTGTYPSPLVTSLIAGSISKSITTVYQATSDGFLLGNSDRTSASHELTVYTDSANPPTTAVQIASAVWVSGGQSISLPISVPIKKSNYYKITGSGCGVTYSFIPMGTA